MRFKVGIDVMPRAEVADPQGRTVERALPALGFEGVDDVRIGKHVELSVDAPDVAAARRRVEALCERLLANSVIETFTIHVREHEGAARP